MIPNDTSPEAVARNIANMTPEQRKRLAKRLDHTVRNLEAGQFFVTVNGDRGRIWKNAVGTSTFPVTSKNPEPSSIMGEILMAYYVDFRRVSPRLRDRIEHFLAERWSQTLDRVRAEIREGGLPIIAKNVTTPEGWVYGDGD